MVYRGAAAPGPGTSAFTVRHARLQLFASTDDYPFSCLERQAVLHHMLNGNWESSTPVHFCAGATCCPDEEAFDANLDMLTRALVPTACPVLQRSRWTNSQHAINWLGMMVCAHDILKKVLGPWLRELGNSSEPVVPADFAKEPHPYDDDDSDQEVHCQKDQAIVDAKDGETQ